MAITGRATLAQTLATPPKIFIICPPAERVISFVSNFHLHPAMTFLDEIIFFARIPPFHTECDFIVFNDVQHDSDAHQQKIELTKRSGINVKGRATLAYL